MHIVTETSELAAICEEYAAYPYITVDTEFLRERTYWSQLCLVQMARPGGGDKDGVLIDPLAAGIDLAPLYALMADENVVKVFHAARQDVEIFWHQGKVMPTPLFDTQVAAMVCGHGEQVGYETLVRKVANEQVDKSSRFTDWSRRPLSEKQLVYALADVTHLRVVYEKLSAEIDSAERGHWVAEEMAVLCDPATYDLQPANAWRRVKARAQSPKLLAIVRELAAWRERMAQDRNVPRGRVLKDDALMEIVSAQPKSAEELGRLRLVQREARKPEISEQIIAAVAAGLALPKEDRPQVDVPPRRREGSQAIADLLKVFLKARAEEIGVAPKLIAPAADLEALAGEDEPNVPALSGWRREVFGEEALRIKSGELALVAQPGGVRVIEVGSA